jgi:FAD/FMN-containing dehydrogenase
MTAGSRPDADPSFAGSMLTRNRELFERARSVGGVRYPIETVDFSNADWRAHYGDRWAYLRTLKRRFDPDALLCADARVFH